MDWNPVQGKESETKEEGNYLLFTAKPAERQKKLTILGEGLAKQSESQQCKFQWVSLLVPLTSNSQAVHANVV